MRPAEAPVIGPSRPAPVILAELIAEERKAREMLEWRADSNGEGASEIKANMRAGLQALAASPGALAELIAAEQKAWAVYSPALTDPPSWPPAENAPSASAGGFSAVSQVSRRRSRWTAAKLRRPAPSNAIDAGSGAATWVIATSPLPV
jgi:hypothetical protein